MKFLLNLALNTRIPVATQSFGALPRFFFLLAFCILKKNEIFVFCALKYLLLYDSINELYINQLIMNSQDKMWAGIFLFCQCSYHFLRVCNSNIPLSFLRDASFAFYLEW